MKFAVWDGYDAYGLSASDWKKSFPVPVGGKLLFILNEDGTLQAAQQYAPGGGRVAITDKNLEAVKAAYAAAAGEADQGSSDYAQMKSLVDWLFLYVTTGEA